MLMAMCSCYCGAREEFDEPYDGKVKCWNCKVGMMRKYATIETDKSSSVMDGVSADVRSINGGY